MPDTHICVHCGHVENTAFSTCPACMGPQPGNNPAPDVPVQDVASTPVQVVGDVYVGIDPGSRYTGVVVIDANEKILASWIFVRPELEKDFVVWSRDLINIIDKEVISLFPDALIGIENVTDPKGFKGGAHSAMNPKDIIRTAQILGAMSMHYKDAVYISPANNGSQSPDYYPPELSGRRPKDLIGSNNRAGTRRHEKSAYDVAMKTLRS